MSKDACAKHWGNRRHYGFVKGSKFDAWKILYYACFDRNPNKDCQRARVLVIDYQSGVSNRPYDPILVNAGQYYVMKNLK
jgi:hypothetical protein